MDRAKVQRGGGVLALCALSALGGALYSDHYYQGVLAQVSIVRETDTPYPLIAPLLNVVFPKELSGSQFAPMLDKVKSAVSGLPQGELSRYSFYFRDLTDSHWTGINENDAYNPASMLKVVAAIAAYRQAEDQPGFLSRSATYTQALAQANTDFPFAPKVSLLVGSSYSLPTLIKKMLSDSDNAAKDLLLSSIDPSELSDIYNDLEVPAPNQNDSSSYTISALDYSRFFRVLYNASYLTHEDSNEVLEYLKQSTFTQGLVAGVASTTPVAHKWGEHVNGQDGQATSVELHDCGIVYHPTRPYFVCIMTEGKDTQTLAALIAKLSAITYKEVDSNYR